MSDKINCQICNAEVHAIQRHINEHADDGWDMQRYRSEFPEAPVLSEVTRQKLIARKNQGNQSAVTETALVTQGAFHEVFGLGEAPAALSKVGKPIPVTVLSGNKGDPMVPKVDESYVFNIDTLKTVVMCLERSMPLYLWGHMGTGKTSVIQQACALTLRPTVRIQHTYNTEESQILGQWIVRGKETVFQPGWLPLAMRHGWVYLADEYDFAVPEILSVYQAVLEGAALVIKEADDEWRIVEPHPNFRFCATGNTNGAGDETGLYQGTQLQNAANYERFDVVMQVGWMDAAIEKQILISKAQLDTRDAANFIKFAKQIRESLDRGGVTIPISPRSLIKAATVGMLRGNFIQGIEYAYINRLPAVERETASQMAQRVFA